ncbi:MAG: hypothetical protein COA63_014070 [Methylophaga sp.]|nr:hypothetical protein [Methylophaga sp.]
MTIVDLTTEIEQLVIDVNTAVTALNAVPAAVVVSTNALTAQVTAAIATIPTSGEVDTLIATSIDAAVDVKIDLQDVIIQNQITTLETNLTALISTEGGVQTSDLTALGVSVNNTIVSGDLSQKAYTDAEVVTLNLTISTVSTAATAAGTAASAATVAANQATAAVAAINSPAPKSGFRVLKTTQQILAANPGSPVDTKIDYDTEIFDINDDYNLASNTFTASQAGLHYFHHVVRDDNATGHARGAEIYHNGVSVIRSITGNYQSIDYETHSVSIVLQLDIGDTVEPYFWVNTAGNASQIEYNAKETQFMGYAI